jgi:hypothetical protein
LENLNKKETLSEIIEFLQKIPKQNLSNCAKGFKLLN